MHQNRSLLTELRECFYKQSNQERALKQQAYMKSELPYWGIAMPQVRMLSKPLLKKYAPTDNADYRQTVINCFKNATHREEWYAALLYAQHHKAYIRLDNKDVYQEIICMGQWWDITDVVAPHLIGKALSTSDQLGNHLMHLIKCDNVWLRRSALIAQLNYKQATDFALLQELILTVAHEREFFIAKAIGWALRSYSYSNPHAVKNFISNYRYKLSALSVRQALRALG